MDQKMDQINKIYNSHLQWKGNEKKAYVCSPLGAETRAEIEINMMAAREYCRTVELAYGFSGKAPHGWLPEFLDDHIAEERQLGLEIGMTMLRNADMIVVCGDRISSGMRAEIIEAVSLQKPILVHDVDNLREIESLVTKIVGSPQKTFYKLAQELSEPVGIIFIENAPDNLSLSPLDLYEDNIVMLSPESHYQKLAEQLDDYYFNLDPYSYYDNLEYGSSREQGREKCLEILGNEDELAKVIEELKKLEEDNRSLIEALQAVQDTLGGYRVVFCGGGKAPEVTKIEGSLDSMQDLVGGRIEIIPLDVDTSLEIVCNEDGKSIGLKGNRRIYDGTDVIAGDFFVCAHDANGQIRNLTDYEVKTAMQRFAKVENCSGLEMNNEIEVQIIDWTNPRGR